MRAPRGLSAAGRRAWQHAVFTLEQAGEDPELSSEAVRSFAEAVSESEALRAEWRRLGSAGIRVGPKGGVYQEPLLLAIDRAEHRVADLGDRLGLSPASRRKLGRAITGRPPGAASARDRQLRVPKRTKRAKRGGKVTELDEYLEKVRAEAYADG